MTHFKRYIRNLFIVICLILAFLYAIDWWIGTHYYKFQIQDKFKVCLKSDVCTSCFLDYQIEYDMSIEDLKNNKDYDYQFFYSDGPSIQFGYLKQRPELILVKGTDRNDNFSWLIDLDKNTVELDQPYDSIQNKMFVITHEIDSEGILHKK